MKKATLDRDEIKRLFGDLTDHQIAEVLGSALPFPELERISMLLSQETDHMVEMGRLTPKGRDLYDYLLRTDEQWDPEA